jgi:hypothetical protein
MTTRGEGRIYSAHVCTGVCVLKKGIVMVAAFSW